MRPNRLAWTKKLPGAIGVAAKDPRKKIVAKADLWFSRFIRLRDSVDGVNGQCRTCGRWSTVKEVNCGHFIKRQFFPTRYDPKNCIWQCVYCNKYQQGCELAHAEYIASEYGQETLDLLRWKKDHGHKPSTYEIELIGKEYQNQAKRLMERFGIMKW